MAHEHPKDQTIVLSWIEWREQVARVAEHYLDREYTDEEIDEITKWVVGYISESFTYGHLPQEFWGQESDATEFWEFVAELAEEL